MSFIHKILDEGESIVAPASTSKAFVVAPPILAIALPTGIVYAIFGMQWHALIWPLIGGSLLAVPLLYYGMHTLITSEVAVTNRRFISTWGFSTRTSKEISLENIEGVRVDESFLGKYAFNYGTITVTGTGGTIAHCPGIAKPHEFKNYIYKAKELLLERQKRVVIVSNEGSPAPARDIAYSSN